MSAILAIQQSLFTSTASDGVKIFPALLIDRSQVGQTTLCAADQALEYYRSIGLYGARSTRNIHGYGEVIRSLNREPPWVEGIRMDEMDRISPERESQLRPLTVHVQEISDEVLFARFHQHLSDRHATLGPIGKKLSLLDQTRTLLSQPTELDDFKSLVALARLLGPSLAYDLEQVLLYEFAEESSGVIVGTGAPDLLLWTPKGENELWFFSEVKAPGDYLRETQKDWIARNWELVHGHFLLTILE
jgi:hypothetical protein